MARASMSEPHPLVELERLDSYGDELRARRDGLPERAALAAGEAELEALAPRQAELGGRRSELARDEREAEGRVEDCQAKAREAESKLYSGQIKVPKELEALQLELRELQRRLGEQEEAELAVMEQEERLARELAELEARSAELAKQLPLLREAIASTEAEVAAELARIHEARAGVAAHVEEGVLAHYERLRTAPQHRGRTVVRIEKGACSGCWATLPIAFEARLPKNTPGATALCPRCGRILVL